MSLLMVNGTNCTGMTGLMTQAFKIYYTVDTISIKIPFNQW